MHEYFELGFHGSDITGKPKIMTANTVLLMLNLL
jgi:hypothetical protein